MIRTLASLALAAAVFMIPGSGRASDLVVTTDPPNASVQVDGVGYGQAPVTIPKLGPGPHLLRVSAEGYETRIDSIELGGGEVVEVHAPLHRKPAVVAPTPPPTPAPAPVVPPAPAAQPAPPPAPPAPVAMPAPQPAPAPADGAAQPPSGATLPTPVSQLPVAWGTQRKSFVLIVETIPAGATVQVVGLPGSKPSPATFTGFAKGTVTLLVSAPGYREKRVAVDLEGDSRTRVVLQQ